MKLKNPFTCKYKYSPASIDCVGEVTDPAELISIGLEFLRLISSASRENLLSNSFLRASKLSLNPCRAAELRNTISDSVFSRRGLKKSNLPSPRKNPMFFSALKSFLVSLPEELGDSVPLLMKSVSTGSPFLRFASPVMPASEPLRLLKNPLDRSGLALLRSTKIAECRAELSGKKSEFSLLKPLKKGLIEILASLSPRRCVGLLMILSGIFSCCFLSAITELPEVDEDDSTVVAEV